MQNRLPLVYFHGLVPSRYMAIWPVYVVGDAMSALEFSVTCEDAGFIDSAFSLQDEGEPFGELKRSYAATEVQRRIHIKVRFVNACYWRISVGAHSAVCGMRSCWMRRTSSPTASCMGSQL